MDISAVGSPQVKAITPMERPEEMVHHKGAPFTNTSETPPQPTPRLADETKVQPGVKTEVRREDAIGMNVTEFRDSKTGEIISQIPSRQIIAMAISLSEEAQKKREESSWY